MASVDFTSVTPISAMRGDSPAETLEMRGLLRAALEFLRGFSWCLAIEDQFAGIVVPGVIGVFLFRIQPSEPDIDSWLWVVIGDLPPAYLVTDDAPTPTAAIGCYVEEMQHWVDAARVGESVDALIPVNAEPTRENADLLDRRLRLLSDEFVTAAVTRA